MDRYQWKERYAAQPLLWAVDPGPFLSGELGDRPAGRALDLGAGEGRTALWLAERGWHVTAVDFSDVALERGRQRVEAAAVPGSVEWVCADLVDFDPTGASYDLVLLMFIHLPADDRRRLLRLAAATLAPGGGGGRRRLRHHPRHRRRGRAPGSSRAVQPTTPSTPSSGRVGAVHEPTAGLRLMRAGDREDHGGSRGS